MHPSIDLVIKGHHTYTDDTLRQIAEKVFTLVDPDDIVRIIVVPDRVINVVTKHK